MCLYAVANASLDSHEAVIGKWIGVGKGEDVAWRWSSLLEKEGVGSDDSVLNPERVVTLMDSRIGDARSDSGSSSSSMD